jgi:hypothetical protein
MELVDVLHRVLVLGQHSEAVGNVLQAVVSDEIGARIERVPAGAVERDRPLQAQRGLVEELRSRGGPKGEALEVGEQAHRSTLPP